MRPTIKAPTVDDILTRMIAALPSEMYAAADPNSNIYNLLRAVAVSQHESLVMLQEAYTLLDTTKQEDTTRLKWKIERKGAFWAP